MKTDSNYSLHNFWRPTNATAQKKNLLESPSSNSRIMLPIAYVNVLSNHLSFDCKKKRGKIHTYVFVGTYVRIIFLITLQYFMGSISFVSWGEFTKLYSY
jgi:hypothetical protein